MKTYKNFIEEATNIIKTKNSIKNTIKQNMTGDTHSLVDGLNRGKNALMRGKPSINARIVREKDLKPLNPEQIKKHDDVASDARKRGDYFTGSTFGNAENRYSVQDAINRSRPKRRIKTSGFVTQQVSDYWQGDEKRARSTSNHPVIIMKHR